MVHTTDVVIIGAGPVGLFGVFECGMLGLKCHVIDALDTIGGQCMALYPEKPIYDIPAHPMVSGKALIYNLEQQARPFSPVYHLSQTVLAVEPLQADGKLWRVTTSKNEVIETRTIIIAAGVGAFGPNRPPLDNILSYENTSIFYHVTRPDQFFGKHVVIAGGGDSAVDWALALYEKAASLAVVHRRPKFRAAPDNERKLNELAQAGKINLVVPYQLDGLDGENGQLTSVRVKSLEDDVKEIQAEVLLPFFGLSMTLGPIAEWGLNLDKSHITVDHSTAETNRPGIYAIGDIATYRNKLKLILTGFSDAAHCAHAIRRFLYPSEVIHFEYSTTKGLPEVA